VAGAVAAGTAAAGTGLAAVGRVLPYTTLVIAAFVPLAAVIYLVTTTSWTTAERTVLCRWHAGAAAGQVTGAG
jgi:YidC/Oxa1 family membrane protein insertase